MKKYLAILGLIFVTVIWGGGFVASDMALESLTPFQIVTGRFFLASLLMGILSWKTIPGMTREEVRAGVWMGVALFAGFALQIVGLSYTTPSKNAFLTATNVVMVPFISFLFCHKKIGARGMIGAILAVAGVGVLSLNGNFSLGLGDGLTLLCAVGFAFQIFLTGIFVKNCRAEILNFLQMLTAFILSAICMIVCREFTVQADAKGWLSLLYLGVVSTTVCYLLQTTCQKYVEETKAAVILSMESVFGTLLSILILHERVTVRMLIGCIMIFAAVLISNSEPEQAVTENIDPLQEMKEV
ncbi:MAG: DMT family transporter [Fusicatenibacter sp.]|nr:DMT family transporter [Fusicatenibacter sp.]